jgi:DNA polymerase/3'-5' exonuclease PolX
LISFSYKYELALSVLKYANYLIRLYKLELIYRRPQTEYSAALIYFTGNTGNDFFNRSLRLLASKKKMRLNQCGLYKNVVRGYKRQKMSEGELVEGKSERRIFELLGVQWREPHER